MTERTVDEVASPTGQPQSPDTLRKTRNTRIAGATPTELISLFGSPALFVLIFLIFYVWLGGDFFDSSQRLLEFSQAVPALLITVGVVVCLAVGQFDLSLAYNASFSAFLVIGLNYNNDVPMWACIVISLAVSSFVGLINGVLITRFHINAFIATLGTGGVLLGLARVYSDGGQAITPTPTDHPLPMWFPDTFGSFQNTASTPLTAVIVVLMLAALLHTVNGRALPPATSRPLRIGVLVGVASAVLLVVVLSGALNRMSVNIVVFLATALVLWVVMTYTSFGRNLYAVGSNPKAAGYAGVSVARHTTLAFVLAGLMAGMGGVMLAALQGSAVQGSADALLLPAYAGAFLSTVIVSRGRFHVWGAVAGSLGLTYVASGLVIAGVSFTWADVINGAVLIAAVALSSVVRRSGR